MGLAKLDNFVRLSSMNTNYNLNYYLNDIRCRLSAVYSDSMLCQQYAWWILQALFKKTKTELIIQSIVLSVEQEKKYEQWLHLLVVEKMPLQYVLGFVPFMDMEILVEPPILIPRPETEEWCLKVIEQMKLLDNKKISILDLATGSGCIALACASRLPQATIIATDISDSALALTKKNIEHNKASNITCIKSDLFNSIPHNMKFDCIVSNPPYISFDEYKILDESVSRWEDINALAAEDNGLAIINKIIAQAPQFIQTNDEMRAKKIPQIVIEIGYAQGQAVKELLQARGYHTIVVHKDLAGKDRVATARID